MGMQRIRDHYFFQRGKVYSYRRGNYARLRDDQVPDDVREAAARMTSEPGPRVRDKRTLKGKHSLAIATRVPELEAHAPIAPLALPEAPASRAAPAPVRATPMTVLVKRLVEQLLTDDGDVRELVRELIREQLHEPDFRAEILDRLAGAEVERWSETAEPEPAGELAAPDDAEDGGDAPDANAGNVEPASASYAPTEPLPSLPGPMGSFPGPMGDFNPTPRPDRDAPTEPELPRPEPGK
jgi:hypothetical protein